MLYDLVAPHTQHTKQSTLSAIAFSGLWRAVWLEFYFRLKALLVESSCEPVHEPSDSESVSFSRVFFLPRLFAYDERYLLEHSFWSVAFSINKQWSEDKEKFLSFWKFFIYSTTLKTEIEPRMRAIRVSSVSEFQHFQRILLFINFFDFMQKETFDICQYMLTCVLDKPTDAIDVWRYFLYLFSFFLKTWQ